MLPSWERLFRARDLWLYTFGKWAIITVPLLASGIQFLEAHTPYRVVLPVHLLPFYLAAWFFVVGSITADLFGPSLIKDHKNFHQFLAFIHSQLEMIAKFRDRTERDQNELAGQIANELQVQTGEHQYDAEEASQSHVGELLEKLALLKSESAIVDECGEIWKNANTNERNPVRAVVALMLLISGILGFYATFIDASLRVFKASG